MQTKPSSVRAKRGAAPAGMDPEMRAAVLEALGTAIASKRKEAIDARLNSGIEQQWKEDEEFYQGFDDANRHEFVNSRSKPTEGGRSVEQGKTQGSTIFPNITGPYVDAAAAKVADMLLPTDDRNFVIEPTPVPDILDEEEGWPPVLVPQAQGLLSAGAPQTPAAAIQGDPAAAAGMPGAPQVPPQPAAPDEPDPILAQLFAKLKATKEKADTAAQHAQDKIDDYLTECSYQDQLRLVIDDCARIGTGVLKGPVPEKRKVRKWARNPKTGEITMVVKEVTKPASKRVNPWNVFPDGSCGEDIQNGAYFFERDFLTAKRLRALKGGHGAAAYLDNMIDRVLEEGPQKRNDTGSRGFHQEAELAGSDVYEIWYYYGVITGKELSAAGCECKEGEERGDDEQFHVIVTVVNDTVIKAALNPLESGEFPYDVMPWKRKPNMPWGVGVSRQGRVAQRICVAATRNLMDNAGAASRPHKVMMPNVMQGIDPWTWELDSEQGVADVRAAMAFFEQPTLQPSLTAIIQMSERMMEMHTGLPMIILGMQGNVQETAHGRALQNNNGSMVLRRVARYFDAVTERHIRRYHTWMMIYEAEDAGLAAMDLQVKARGSAALVERDLQNQQLPTLMSLSLNPAFGWDPELTGEEFLKAQHFSPKAFKLSEEKKAKMAQTPPPKAPQVEVAGIREQGATQRLQMQLEHDKSESGLDRNLDLALKQIDAQLASAELSVDERLALDDIKATLAGITLKVQTQRELSALRGGQFMTPPTEPAGRAPAGQAFAQ